MRFFFLSLLASALLLAGCQARSAPAAEDAATALTDQAYLTAPVWDDGQAEVAFYEVHRTRNQYGEAADQRFTAGTYLVKHRFSPEAMTKVMGVDEGVSAFKYALFYEFESGSYQYKRHYVVNAAQAHLAPLKASFTSFDWCANLYREMAFHPSGEVAFLKRSDDYGNASGTFDYEAGAFPPTALPLLIRGLDFSEEEQHTFAVVLPDGRYVSARARRAGRDTLRLPGGPETAERIRVTYDAAVPSLIAEETDLEEIYWRGTGEERTLLQMEGGSGRYRMTLIEQLRSAYWEENLWPRLARVEERP